MNFIYTKIMTFLLGEAIANSDRIKTVIAGAVAQLLLTLAAGCQVCQAFLTDKVVLTLSVTIATYVVSLVMALTKRDIAAPGETVHGEALPDAEFLALNPPPKDALGTPGKP